MHFEIPIFFFEKDLKKKKKNNYLGQLATQIAYIAKHTRKDKIKRKLWLAE